MANSPPTVTGYESLEVIGRGGTSVVYSASEIAGGRRVALKVLNVDASDADSQRSFERECEVLRLLSGVRGIVEIYGSAFTTDGRPCVVMELMSRGSLSSYVKRRGLMSQTQAVYVGGILARALVEAHRKGVFHRDIKPANVLISEIGNISLSDFGISSHSYLASSTVTVASLSPPFAPPERFTSDSVDEALADIYSLGATLYYTLSGHPPFGTSSDGGMVGLFGRISDTPLPSLTRTDVSGELEDALACMMAKEPNGRYADAEAVANVFADLEKRWVLDRGVDRSNGSELSFGADDAAQTSMKPLVLRDPNQSLRSDGRSLRQKVDDAQIISGAIISGQVDESASLAEDSLSERGRLKWKVSFAAVAIVAVLGLIGYPALRGHWVIAGDRMPDIVVSVVDSTDRNPLSTTRVSISFDTHQTKIDLRVRKTVRFQVVNSDGSSKTGDLVIAIPEKYKFKIDPSLGSGSDSKVILRISDNAVDIESSMLVGSDSYVRKNPVDADREKEVIAAQRVRNRRIAALTALTSVSTSLKSARDSYNQMWSDRDSVPYTEIVSTVNNEVLPLIDSAVSVLNSVAGVDSEVSLALEAMRECLIAERLAYIRDSILDPQLTEEQNDAQQNEAFETSYAACSYAQEAKSALYRS